MAGTLMLINPRKRRRGRKSKSRRRHTRVRRHKRYSRARRRNPIRFHKRRSHRRHRRYSRARRRNPISMRSLMPSGITGKIMGAVKGAAGALAVDAAYTYIPLPAMLKSGPLASVTRLAMTFVTGWLASFAVGKNMAAQMVEGALTVQAYTIVKPMISGFIPLAGPEIDGLGYYSPGSILDSDLSPLPPLNAGGSLNAYISGAGDAGQVGPGGGFYDESIGAYIS